MKKNIQNFVFNCKSQIQFDIWKNSSKRIIQYLLFSFPKIFRCKEIFQKKFERTSVGQYECRDLTNFPSVLKLK